MPPIPSDILCIHCSYNLRTLSTAALCPECGRPITDTLNNPLTPHARKVLRRGSLLASLAFLIYLLLASIVVLTEILRLTLAFASTQPFFVVSSLTIIAESLLWLLGVSFLCVRPPSAQQRLALTLAYCSSMFTFLLGCRLLADTVAGTPYSPPLSLGLALLTLFLRLVSASLTFALLTSLADFCNRSSLRLHFRILSIFFGLSALLFPITQCLLWSDSSPQPFLILFLTLLASLPYSAFLLLLFRRGLNHSIHGSVLG